MSGNGQIRPILINVGLSLKDQVSLWAPADRDQWVSEQPQWLLDEMVRDEWWWTSRPEQVPPDGSWHICLACAGRGFGKSRAGSEWIVEQVLRHPYDESGTPTEWLVIAETLSDARTICMEGPAGILNVLNRRKIVHRYLQSPRPMVRFPDGAKIYCEGADDEDVGRGYNAAGAWLDEIAKWPKPRESWYEGILPSLRSRLVGDHPRAFVTTTPKPIPLLQEWLRRQDHTIHTMRGSTFDNAANLSAPVLEELRKRYEGTTIGRQELYGELLEMVDGALFKRTDIERNRVDEVPDSLTHIVVGVDPALTGEDDEMGVVVIGRTADSHHYVMADRSITAVGREAAVHAWMTFAEFGADTLLYESNLGKRWMTQVFTDAYYELTKIGVFPEGTTPPMKDIDAKIGKKTRAEPVAMRYEQAKVHHVGKFELLEDQLCGFSSWDTHESPDRLDALVHACRWLMAGERRAVRVTSPLDLPSTLRQLYQSDSFW